MSTNPEGAQRGESGKFSLTKLALLSLLTGAGIGLIIGCFRVALEYMNTARTDSVAWAHQWPVAGFVLVCATVAVTTAFAAWLAQRSGQPAAGSGIPHVEAVIEGKLPAAPILLFPIGARVERHPARSGPAARPRNCQVPLVVVGGRDASTGRRSRPEGVTLQRGFDGAKRREPDVGSTRAPFVSAKRRRTNSLAAC